MPDVIVTGLPRSGLTMVSACIDSLPDSICLNSPASHIDLAKGIKDAVSYSKLLVDEFATTRTQLLNQTPILDFRSESGAYLAEGPYDAKSPPPNIKPIPFTLPGLTPDFILAAKHHGFYTSVLPELVALKHFTIIAVIRDPLEIFAAWQTLPQPLLVRGNPLGIARFWPEALEIATNNKNTPACYAQLYDAYLGRYHALREYVHIVKYEDAVASPTLISKILERNAPPAISAQHIADAKRVFTSEVVDEFRDALRRYGVFTKLYYKDI